MRHGPAPVAARGFTSGPGTAAPAVAPAIPPAAPMSVVGRVMAVLAAFVAEGPQLRSADIARITGLPSATTSRLLKELVDAGAVQRIARGQYAVGPRLWEIGVLGASVYRVWVAARPKVALLSQLTGHAAHLTVRGAGCGLRLEDSAGEAVLVAPCWVVEQVPLHATASGLVLLAFSDGPLLDDVLAGTLERYTPQTIVSAAPLRSAIAEVRRHGFAISRDQHHLGQASLAAPVLDSRGHAIAALDIDVRRQEDIRGLHRVVRRCAFQLSQHLAAPCRHETSQTDHLYHSVE